MVQLITPPLHEIAKNIKKIQNDFGHICSGFKRLKVISYTKEDEEAEFAKRMCQMIRLGEEKHE